MLEHKFLNSGFVKAKGTKVGLPAYFLYLTKDARKNSENDALTMYRIASSKKHKTNMHILTNFYKTVI